MILVITMIAVASRAGEGSRAAIRPVPTPPAARPAAFIL
jgi:hypothetical protein